MRTKSNQPKASAPVEVRAQFKTTAIYVSGAICGRMWMPQAMGGILLKQNARGPWGFFNKGDSLRDALNSLLLSKGGDFQNALFAADTVLRIERRSIQAPGKYTVHVKEREISELPDCADLVNAEAFIGDFIND